MIKPFLMTVAILTSCCAQAKILTNEEIVSRFISNVKTSADNDVDLDTDGFRQLRISCPSPSASGAIILRKASYEFGKSIGVFDFANNASPATMTFLIPIYKGDDFDSDTVGFTFAFKMPRGQFFVDVKENGNIRAGVNVNGESGVTYENCKLNMKDINDD
ncbi:hypothetical protein ACW0LU_004214 [Shigella flexneri]